MVNDRAHAGEDVEGGHLLVVGRPAGPGSVATRTQAPRGEGTGDAARRSITVLMGLRDEFHHASMAAPVIEGSLHLDESPAQRQMR
jgi:hypothetical protein